MLQLIKSCLFVSKLLFSALSRDFFKRRIFFDYEDFYLGEDLPPYVSPCTQNAPVISRGSPPVCVLSALVNENSVRYIDVNMRPGPMEGPFLVVPRVCGDCTAIGSPEAPEFWTDE